MNKQIISFVLLASALIGTLYIGSTESTTLQTTFAQWKQTFNYGLELSESEVIYRTKVFEANLQEIN